MSKAYTLKEMIDAMIEDNLRDQKKFSDFANHNLLVGFYETARIHAIESERQKAKVDVLRHVLKRMEEGYE